MKLCRSCISIFLAVFLCTQTLLAYAANNYPLTSPIVQKAITEIQTHYVWSIERTLLEQRCLLASQQVGSEEPKINACITAMMESLDRRSSYFDPSKTKELTAQVHTQQADTASIRVESLFNGDMGYIAILRFLNDTKELISLKTSGFLSQTQPLTGFIIDLRNCPGGILQSVIDVAGLFLPYNTLIGSLETRRASSQKQKLFTSARSLKHGDVSSILKTIPLIVLVNHNTEGGAELLAAALKESGRATIIGNATAKKGDVQKIIPLSDESFLKLTTHIMVTSSGNLINEVGVKVDIESSNRDLSDIGPRLEDDPVIKKAYAKFKSNI